jgi:hypothetical protein
MYNENDYNGESNARDARETSETERDARMEACDAGRVSYRAAIRGGDEYATELRESAQLAARVEASRIAPVMARTIYSWERAVTRPSAIACIGNGLFVRVGNGQNRRRA